MDWKIHTFAELPSTQVYALELAERENMPEGTVIQALTQTKGKGRHGKEWFSPMGNLHMSFILRPDCSAEQATQMSFVMAVAMRRAICHYLPKKEHDRVTLKWPNDVLIETRKCAGILIETASEGKGAIDALIVGTGVNILSAPEEGIAIVEATDNRVAVHPFRDQVLAETKVLYERWKADGFSPIRKNWMAHARGLEQNVEVVNGAQSQKGVFKGIDDRGALVLETDQETKHLSAGSLKFL